MGTFKHISTKTRRLWPRRGQRVTNFSPPGTTWPRLVPAGDNLSATCPPKGEKLSPAGTNRAQVVPGGDKSGTNCPRRGQVGDRLSPAGTGCISYGKFHSFGIHVSCKRDTRAGSCCYLSNWRADPGFVKVGSHCNRFWNKTAYLFAVNKTASWKVECLWKRLRAEGVTGLWRLWEASPYDNNNNHK